MELQESNVQIFMLVVNNKARIYESEFSESNQRLESQLILKKYLQIESVVLYKGDSQRDESVFLGGES